MSILDVIQRSTEFLARKSVASPRLQVELLLAHLLRMPRMQLYLSFERVLTPAELDAFRDLVQRRGQREPLQYILGSTSFCGFEIALSRDVLIPRPETESLAERAWQFLQKTGGNPLVLEIGTGSGCLAIALARNALMAKVCATDFSAPALELARRNAETNQVRTASSFAAAISSPPPRRARGLISLFPIRPTSPRRASPPWRRKCAITSRAARWMAEPTGRIFTVASRRKRAHGCARQAAPWWNWTMKARGRPAEFSSVKNGFSKAWRRTARAARGF
jgi:hypothetical protein